MKRYIPLQEIRRDSFKAWYHPQTNWYYQFSEYGLHSEVSEEVMDMDEYEAFKNGYIRVYAYERGLNIETINPPNIKAFKSLQKVLNNKTFPANVKYTSWDTEKGRYSFKNQAFFHAKSIKDAKKE